MNTTTKVLEQGTRYVTDAELLSVIIGGNNDVSIMTARQMLKDHNNSLKEIRTSSALKLSSYKGVGLNKAVTIISSLELGSRCNYESLEQRKRISSSRDIYNLLHPIIGELPHEEFWVIYLNNSNKVLKKTMISKGGLTGTLVDVRIVLKEALELLAVGMIIAHNHPSGTLKPSNADRNLTNKIKESAKIVDIQVLDHVIVTADGYFSFADDGII